MQVHGRCHCVAIRYEAEVQPDTIGLCHCLDCQTLSGAPFRAMILAAADGFRLLSGAPRRYLERAASGAERAHAFCENCGSPVYSCAPVNPSSYSLRVGALDERAEIGRPSRQIWTKRRLPWVPPLAGTCEVEGQP